MQNNEAINKGIERIPCRDRLHTHRHTYEQKKIDDDGS